MKWDQTLTDHLDLALNETTALGVRFDTERGEARMLLEVTALPEEGPIDPDPRRVLVLTQVAYLDFTLRYDDHEPGPAQALASLEEVEAFYARIDFAHPMYGWAFFDISDPAEPDRPLSLVVNGSRQDGPVHTLRWFTECGTLGKDGRGYCMEGLIRFGGLHVERADGTQMPIEEFIASASRWWRASKNHDSRVTGDDWRLAQQLAVANSNVWRPRIWSQLILDLIPSDHFIRRAERRLGVRYS